MEYSESPFVIGIERRLTFPKITWIDKFKLIEYLEKGIQIYPNIDDRIFIGKSIPKCYNNSEKDLPNLLGSVFKNQQNKWQLNSTHEFFSTKSTDNFLVLFIEEPCSYEWIKVKNGQIPKYAFRAAITEEYLYHMRSSALISYIGRAVLSDGFQVPVDSCDDESEDSIIYHEYKHYGIVEDVRELVEKKFTGAAPCLFGKVLQNNKSLLVPFNDLELEIKKYEVLCLKASPAALKILCRTFIRKKMNHSNEAIGKITQIPVTLNNYIKYPSFLKTGDYMLKHEKIVSDDGKFELMIEDNQNLVCRSVIQNAEKLSKEDLIRLEDIQIVNVILKNIYIFWLNRFQIVFDRMSPSRVAIFKQLTNEPSDYKICIADNEESSIPDLCVEILK